jgi:hypothetical protein
MKPRVARFISALLLVALSSGSVAQAVPPATSQATSTAHEADLDQVLPSDFEEVPAAEAERIAPLRPEFLEQYRNAQATAIQPVTAESFDVGTVVIGVVVLDALVNLGKSIWAMIEAGRPKIDLNMNVATAVPQGIKDWTELDSWHDPVSKLYRTQLMTANYTSLGDVYYRLVYTYGGKYKGVGNYLTSVAVVPAQIKVPYHNTFYAQTQVTELINHGTEKDPIAGMTLLLTWGLDAVRNKTMQTVSLHVRGDGGVVVLPSQNDKAEDIKAPVKVDHPADPEPLPYGD